jgi:hypothetical protein|eukprot:COSAG01_NODE_3310_length_6282_cov_2.911693_10_plen_38_part_00
MVTSSPIRRTSPAVRSAQNVEYEDLLFLQTRTLLLGC